MLPSCSAAARVARTGYGALDMCVWDVSMLLSGMSPCCCESTVGLRLPPWAPVGPCMSTVPAGGAHSAVGRLCGDGSGLDEFPPPRNGLKAPAKPTSRHPHTPHGHTQSIGAAPQDHHGGLWAVGPLGARASRGYLPFFVNRGRERIGASFPPIRRTDSNCVVTAIPAPRDVGRDWVRSGTP